MTIGAKIGVWFTVGLVIIAAIGATAYVSTQRLIEENRWVAHTYEVKEGLAHVMSVLKDAETGQRGFLLIDKERYLEPYNTAAVEVHQDIDKLVNLTSDNAAQQESLKQVRKLADSKLAELRETIELRRKSGLESALTVVRSDRGKQIMDELRGVVAEMEGREQQLLEKRTDAAKTSANRTIWTIAVWMPIGLLALAIAAVVLNAHRAIRRPCGAAGHFREEVEPHRYSICFGSAHRGRCRDAQSAVDGFLRRSARLYHTLSGCSLGSDHRGRRAGDRGHHARGAGG